MGEDQPRAYRASPSTERRLPSEVKLRRGAIRGQPEQEQPTNPMHAIKMPDAERSVKLFSIAAFVITDYKEWVRAVRILGAFVLLLMAAALVIAIVKHRPTRHSVSLPDGTVIRLEAVTYGKVHKFSTAKPWQNWLRQHAPFARRFLPTGNGITSSTTTQNDALVFWVSHFDPRTGVHTNDWNGVDIQDRHGCRFRVQGWGTSYDGKMSVSHFTAEAFPRREAKFSIYVRTDGAHEAQFEIENPARGPFPEWAVEELPATRNDAGLLITLNRLRLRGSTTPYVSTEFTVRQNGEPTKDWDDKRVQLFDATGNMGWNFLCTNEPAWKVSARFYRVAGAQFAEEEVWRLPKMRMPTNGEGITVNQSMTLNGVQLKLLAFAGAGSFKTSNGVFLSASPSLTGNSWSMSSGVDKGVPYVYADVANQTPFLLMQVTGLPSDNRLLIRMKDANGKAISADDHGTSNDIHMYAFPKAAMPEEVTLEFMINMPRRAEFIVKPPMAEAGAPRR